MNIIKLKDKIRPNDEYYNIHLKGKYAYWIHMKYIVSFDDMDNRGYTLCEEDISKLLKNEEGEYPKPYGCPYYNIYEDFDPCEISDYIDLEETDKINSVTDFVLKNQYNTSSELTIEEVKLFRTWLAKTLLTIDEYEEDVLHMLLYYANNMYDDIIKYLLMYNSTAFLDKTTTGCSCCANSTLLDLAAINTCDPIAIYKLNIYNKMVQVFSDIDFWSDKPEGFLMDFKLYIENILVLNLSLGNAFYSDFVDCGCHVGSNEEKYRNMLLNLITSIQYIINKNTSSHKLFIHDSFSDWAKYLYEFMQW